MKPQHLDCDAVLVEHRGQRGDRAVRGGGGGLDAIAERQRGPECLGVPAGWPAAASVHSQWPRRSGPLFGA